MTELIQLKDFLISLLTEARELDKKAKGSAHTAIDANIRLLERQIVWLSNSIKVGTIDMDKAKSEIKILEEGVFESVGRSKRASPVVDRILELAGDLEKRAAKKPNQGHYVKVDPQGIDPTNFATKVYNLQGRKIAHDIKPKSALKIDGELVKGLFLVKLTKEQMSAEPKRRTKQGA